MAQIPFSDDFNRADNASLTNGWTQQTAQSDLFSNTCRIVGNNTNGACFQQSSTLNGFAISFTLLRSSAGAGNANFGVCFLMPNVSITGINWLGAIWDQGSSGGTWFIVDSGTNKSSTVFALSVGTTYNVELLVRTDYSMDFRCWDTASARPSTPTLTQAAFTPSTPTAAHDNFGFYFSSWSGGDYRVDNFNANVPTGGNNMLTMGI